MPRYEYRCRACGDTFTVTRPMAESSAPAGCPDGHDDTVRLLTTVGLGGSRGAGADAGVPAAPASGPAAAGGCCGGGCCG